MDKKKTRETSGVEGDLYEVHLSGTDHAQQFAHTGWWHFVEPGEG